MPVDVASVHCDTARARRVRINGRLGRGAYANRRDFRRLAELRLADAQFLLAGRRYAAAYYLAGYAVECGLKACIARQIRQYEFPRSARFSRDVFTHDLKELVKHADLGDLLAEKIADSEHFKRNCEAVAKWTEESRYLRTSREDAEALFSAITDEIDGVLAWIRQRW
jgi:HEPN domain-containing protein